MTARNLALLGLAAALVACTATGRRGDTSDRGWHAGPAPALTHAGWVRESRYLTMRDGVRIAIDAYLPGGLEAGERVPAMLRQTRYWRRTRLRWPLGRLMDDPVPLAREFLGRGYAWIDVDVRGSGASGGWRPHPWSPDEVADGAEILDWIVAQPWSNGRVGAMGESYDGTAAEMLASTGHPALRAIAPRYALFDVYTDIAMPGGVHLSWFTRTWGAVNAALDAHDLGPVAGRLRSWLVVGPREVDADPDRRELEALAREHRWNYDVHRAALELVFRDDRALSQGGLAVDAFSPHARIARLRAGDAAVYSWSGWLDGAYPHAAIKRWRSLARPGDRLLLGPWNHGGDQNVDPRRRRLAPDFDAASELLGFFDHHLRDAPQTLDEHPVHWYTQVEGRWKHGDTWPPPARTRRLHLGASGRLAASRADAGADPHRVDPGTGTGPHARWNSLMGDPELPVEYPDRARRDARLRVYESAPLDAPTEVTGHPVVVLHLRPGARDVSVFAYLEDVAPDGTVTYVTEGQLRALHRRRLPASSAPYATALPWWRSFERADAQPLEPGAVTELVIDLLPTSYLFLPGHRVRLALAGADVDHFAPAPGPPPVWHILRGPEHPSRLELPVVDREPSTPTRTRSAPARTSPTPPHPPHPRAGDRQ